MSDYTEVSFLLWWKDSDDAFKAKHEGDEAVAKAAWNAALSAAAEAIESHGANAQEALLSLIAPA